MIAPAPSSENITIGTHMGLGWSKAEIGGV
jgi:hypothetical protein